MNARMTKFWFIYLKKKKKNEGILRRVRWNLLYAVGVGYEFSGMDSCSVGDRIVG